MKKSVKQFIAFSLSILSVSSWVFAQGVDYTAASRAEMTEVLKAEDELRYDEKLRSFQKSPNAYLRQRAALAAGRIGDDEAIPDLVRLLKNDVPDVSQMAAFAIGEIESIEGSEAILEVLSDTRKPVWVRARAIEAAGKIAAANSKHDKAKVLAGAILKNLEFEAGRRSLPSDEVILLGLTAALRAKPEGAEKTLARFLDHSNWRVRADALNTLARLRAKNANAKAKELLERDKHPIVRANAARILRAAGDKEAVDLLVRHATSDTDLRVRINAIRALSGMKEEKSAKPLINRLRHLGEGYLAAGKNNSSILNEILTLASALGNILEGKSDERALALILRIREFDFYRSTELGVALAKIGPERFLEKRGYFPDNPRQLEKQLEEDPKRALKILGSLVRAVDALPVNDSNREKLTKRARISVRQSTAPKTLAEVFEKVFPGFLRHFAKFKTEDLERVLITNLSVGVPFIRATAASLLGEREPTKKTIEALKLAFKQALEKDKHYDDAQLAILSALVKLDKNAAKESLNLALDHYAFLVRRNAAKLIRDNGLEADFPNLKERVGTVRKYDPKTGSKLGQVLNADGDYLRALSRKNGKSRAIVTTEKGKFNIQFFPEEAPLTVDNFIKLAKSGYFNGVEIHRVVPNFVVQDGDPRGDGNGGPGWQIRCEINQIPYERGMVGMALSGKDTGGSQWFVTHSRQPHLDGGYTVFGKVNETDMKVVDKLVRGDKIISMKIVEK